MGRETLVTAAGSGVDGALLMLVPTAQWGAAATRAPVSRCRAPGLGLKRLQSLSLCRESP